jgi:hypothetical protein
MNCPYCNSPIILPYCTDADGHIFEVMDDNSFQLIVYGGPHQVVRIGYDDYNKYYIMIESSIFFIDPFEIKDCVSVLERHLKLKAFL